MVRRPLRHLVTAAAAAVLAVPALFAVSAAAPTGTASAATRQMPAEIPTASKTPHIDDGATYAIVKVGGKIIVGGSFTKVTPNGGAQVTRNRILAFDASSGALDTGFNPNANNDVNALWPGPNDHTVYVGGAFTNLAGSSTSRLALLDTTTGAKVSGFATPTFNAAVQTIAQAQGHLLLGGNFTTASGQARAGFASANPTTGALDSYLTATIAGHHNYNGSGANAAIAVNEMAVNPAGTALVAIGNFKTVNGVTHDQIVRLTLGSATASVDAWNTNSYTARCFANAYDSYVRGVKFSPDGSFFVVAATGGPQGESNLCDSAARFESSSSGTTVTPTWVDYTGGDTLWSVEITDAAVFVGGHQRWMNNPQGSDYSNVGSVPRPGLVALDPRNGVPLSWNPGRQPRGVSAKWILATSDGLYVGQDTDTFGNRQYNRGKIGFFPYAGGKTLTDEDTGSLPGDVYVGNADGSLSRRTFSGTSVTATAPVSTSVDWSKASGAFAVSGEVYYGFNDGPKSADGFTGGGDLFSAELSGSTLGSSSVVDPYNDPKWSNVQTGSNGSTPTYRGKRPNLYNSWGPTTTQRMSGMFYTNGRLYYTQTGRTGLYSRPFTPESGILTESRTEQTVATPGLTWGSNAGMFYAGGKLYYGNAVDSKLRSVAFNPATGTSGAATVVSGPGVDTYLWNSRTMWLAASAPPPQNDPPVASFTQNCTALACSFDASGSTDDGTITSYAWDFGGDGTASGKTTSHTFSGAGTYQVKLTVTDNGGLSDTKTVPVTVSTGGGTSNISYVGITHKNGNVKTQSASPATGTAAGDGLLLFVSCACSAAPALDGDLTGWTQVGTRSATGVVSTVYAKAAASGDEGRTVSVTYPATLKSDLALLTYDGTAASPVAVADSATDASTTTHTTPTVSVGSGQWAVSYWVDKSSGTTAWTAPGGVTVRDTKYGTGTGFVSSLVADSGGPVSGSSYGGLTATTNAASGRATEWTVALAPGA